MNFKESMELAEKVLEGTHECMVTQYNLNMLAKAHLKALERIEELEARELDQCGPWPRVVELEALLREVLKEPSGDPHQWARALEEKIRKALNAKT